MRNASSKGVSHAPNPSASPLVPDRVPRPHPGHRPGLCGHGGPQGAVRRVARRARPAQNTVFRPVYGAAPTRPLFLSGYAGVNYAAGAPRAVLSPTGYADRPGHPFGFLFGRHAFGPVEPRARGIAYFKVESRLDGPPVSRLQSRPGGPCVGGPDPGDRGDEAKGRAERWPRASCGSASSAPARSSGSGTCPASGPCRGSRSSASATSAARPRRGSPASSASPGSTAPGRTWSRTPTSTRSSSARGPTSTAR